MKRSLICAALLAIWVVSGCVGIDSVRLPDGVSSPDVHATLRLRDVPNAGVNAEIVVVNDLPKAVCVPARFLGLAPWPFVVVDEFGQRISARHDIADDSFGSYSESFFLIGPRMSFTRSLPLSGSINLPSGTAYSFSWSAVAYSCDSVSEINGLVDKLGKLSYYVLEADATLPR